MNTACRLATGLFAAGLSVVALGSPLVETARAADAQAVRAAKGALQKAVNQGSPEGILAARNQFATLSAAEPSNAQLHYWVALADWRVVPILSGRNKDKKSAVRYCKDGLEECERALKADEKFAEALALKAGLQGLSISLEMNSGMTMGMQMGMTMNRARDMAPKNPRILFLDGVNTLYTPEFVGGGSKKSLEKLEKAMELFAAEAAAPAPADPLTPDWGRDDVYVWAGRAAVEGERYADAKTFYKKALEINPENGWVEHALLPALEKKMTEKGNS
ncbi:MAG: hypothetical protein ACREOU_14945 [Candidatus Eiseniibacteriota bacterium]